MIRLWATIVITLYADGMLMGFLFAGGFDLC
jgi:hypothetical protein